MYVDVTTVIVPLPPPFPCPSPEPVTVLPTANVPVTLDISNFALVTAVKV